FGTGYSSMRYLQKLPLDNLKIDLSFVQMLDVAPENIEIVKAIINLAHTLELEVVAEGVEKIEHEEILVNLGCEYCQGYLYAMPLTREEAERYLGECFPEERERN
ncbi:MAG: EAL domain-containing protein, partial [Desulfovibrionaceae bacterium]